MEFALGSAFPVLALTVNDGSTVTNLVQVSNSFSGSQADAVAHLDVVTNSVLQAYQTGTSKPFAFRSAWYASQVVPTSGVYTVTADFVPGDDASQCNGGVMGWFDAGSSNGIVFQVVPENPIFLTTTFQVPVVDPATITIASIICSTSMERRPPKTRTRLRPPPARIIQ